MLGRLAFTLVNGRPWLDVGGATWPDGLGWTYAGVFLVLAAAQVFARPALPVQPLVE